VCGLIVVLFAHHGVGLPIPGQLQAIIRARRWEWRPGSTSPPDNATDA
jgi:hypothetical protein